MSFISIPQRGRLRHPELARTALVALVAVGLSAWVARGGVESTHALLRHIAPVAIALVASALFLSERYEITLAAFLLYLGLLDGVIKLTSGSNVGTLGRDALLYAITLGAVARLAVRRPPITIPPFTGVVVAWVAVCVMQVANPANPSTLHSVAALRQHLEFVPLFFFGYAVLRTQRRLERYLLFVVAIAAVNGIVGLIQANLTPHQLASWGPGYAMAELGTGTTVARVFVSAGTAHVRPLGLGGADGFGGLLCMIAIPATITLLSSRRAARFGWVLIPAMVCIIVGIVSSQTRLVILTSVLAAVIFGLLTLTSRRGLIVLVVGVVLGGTAFWIGSNFISNDANRYSTIAPSHVLSTATSARSGSIALLPTYLVRFPLGGGLGSVGPAGGSSFGGVVSPNASLNAETQFNFLLIETGIPGLLVMIAVFFTVLRAGIQLRRVADPQLQRYLMASVAVLFVLAISWFDTPVTADSPTAPFLWLTAGCIGYWYQQMRAGYLPMRPRRVRNTLALR